MTDSKLSHNYAIINRKMKCQITCWILTRNRVDYAKKSIQSVLDSAKCYIHQSDIFVRISDNSTTPETSKILSRSFPMVPLSYRGGEIRQFEHFKSVIDETDTSHIVMFHDDDVMLPNYFTLIFDLIENNSLSPAFATNSVFIDKHDRNISRAMSLFPTHSIPIPDLITISSPTDLIKRYLNQDYGGFPAFSTYCYATKAVRKTAPDEQTAGLYSDTTFLCEITKHGPISWSTIVGAQIRMHEASESGISSIRDYKLFLTWIRKNPEIIISSIDYNVYRLSKLMFFLKSRNRQNTKYWYRCMKGFLALAFYSATIRKKLFAKLIIY